jgi:sec-independent protein translocase protein TatC
MLPAALPFLISFMGITTTPRLINYFNFVTNLLFWVGICFEAPLVVFVLAKLGYRNRQRTDKAVAHCDCYHCHRCCSCDTPTGDPVNMGLMMLPLMILYLLSVLFAVFARREKDEKHENTETTRRGKAQEGAGSPGITDRV